MKLWGSRFDRQMDPRAWIFNASLPVDRRLAQQDVRASRAWAGALARAGVLTSEEARVIAEGLERVAAEFFEGSFVFQPGDEDIHTAVERRLIELIGPLGGKLHTGRSRNDQVTTDFRLWILEEIPILRQEVVELQRALLARAETELDLPLPGYTHLQRAQPIIMGHWWLSHFWPLQRDQERLSELTQRTAVLPLGSGALAGCPFPVNRVELAEDLGFIKPSQNSLDAVSDRDFAAEFLFWAALLGIHISRLAEAVILFSSAEFGYIEVSDAYATGSSMMPQKKNPDVFELARGFSGFPVGQLIGLLTTLKGLPSAYDKDLQHDKASIFTVVDSLHLLLEVLAGAVSTLRVDANRMRAAIEPAMFATDLADYLVSKGIPFRETHVITGAVVRRALELEIALDEMPLAEYQAIHPAFTSDVAGVFDLDRALARRDVTGGTAPSAVRAQLTQARQVLANLVSHSEVERST